MHGVCSFGLQAFCGSGNAVTRKAGRSSMATAAVCKNSTKEENLPGKGKSVVGRFQDSPTLSKLGVKRVIIKVQDLKDKKKAVGFEQHEKKMVGADLNMAKDDDHVAVDDESCAARNLNILVEAAIAELEKKESRENQLKAGRDLEVWENGIAPAQALRKRKLDNDKPVSVKKAKSNVDGKPSMAAQKKKQANTKKIAKKTRDLSSLMKASEDEQKQKEARDEQDKQFEQTVSRTYQLVEGIENDKPVRIKKEKPVSSTREEVQGALVRSKRGRSQNLPARLHGSVLGKWKKGGKKEM